MAKHKDPAFLFYVSDFLTGTMFMSNEQVGIYIRLLCSQHQHGGIIDKLSFNSLVGPHEIIRGKFIESENGFYNERLMEEMTKRNKKSTNISKAAFDTWEKRKNTIVKENDTIVLQSYYDTTKNDYDSSTIVIRTENENKDIDINKGGVGEKSKPKPKKIITEQEVVAYFLENGYREDIAKKAFKYYADANWVDSTGKKVKNWKQKMQGVWFKDEHKINNNKDEYTNQIRQHGQGLMLDFLGINQNSVSGIDNLLLRGDTTTTE